jgi:hypothetical protein
MEFTFSWEEIALLWREIRGQSNTFNQIATCLEHWQPKFLRDTVDTSYIPYRNGVVQVTAKEIKLLAYKDVHFHIWKERILPREFKYVKERGMFEQFFNNVCGGANGKKKTTVAIDDKFKRAVWYFGYMLHSFKRKSMARAWMLYDIKAGNNGRTGKTIIGTAIGHIRNVTVIDGKNTNFRDNRFALQKINPWTEIVFVDDPHKGMSLGPFFNMITGETDAERKGKDPITLNLKFLFASNWIMELDGTSEQGRQFITQVDDYYIKYAQEHGNILQPIVHAHGKEFFTDWNEKDWSQFDSFAVRCLQTFLDNEQPANSIVGNVLQVRFIQQNDREMFYELCNAFSSNVKKTKEGHLVIAKRVLSNVIKEAGSLSDTQMNKAGKIARDFLIALGAGDVQISSLLISNIPQMAYKITKKFEELDFGEFKDQIQRPKY